MTISLLSSAQIDQLQLQKPISELHPWATADESAVEGYLKAACAAVSRGTRAESKIDWVHYGSGYASFVDAWFYEPTAEFNVKNPIRYGREHVGLVVLLSRLSPYFVFMEGEKHWHAHGGSSYLPAFDMLDDLKNAGVLRLAREIQPILEHHGLVRAYRTELAEPLPAGIKMPTNLADRGYTQFDALFYWED
jgi:hypothetical protein